MAEEGQRTSETGYATLGQAVFGHVILSVFTAPLLAVAVWLLGWFLGPGNQFWTAVGIGLVTAVVSNFVVALCERPVVVRARHSAPGGWDYAIWWFIIPPVVAALVGWWESPGWVLPSVLAAAIVFWAEACWIKPWRRGLSQAEVHEKWEQTKEMTREMFGDGNPPQNHWGGPM